MQKPMPYYLDTPAVQRFPYLYGLDWGRLPIADRLQIGIALGNHAMELNSGLPTGSGLPYLATWDGYRFHNHETVLRGLSQLETEIHSLADASNLIIGIHSNLD